MCTRTDRTEADNGSKATCAAALQSSPKNSVERKPTGKNKKRRLTFAPQIAHVVLIHSRDKLTREEIKDSWWTKEELTEIYQDAKFLIQYTRESGSALVALLDDSLQVSKGVARQFDAKQVQAVIRAPTSAYTSKLETWVLRSKARRGLEKYASKCQFFERISHGREVTAAVVTTKRAGFSNDEIASIYAEQSAAHSMFARWMGHADYQAVYR